MADWFKGFNYIYCGGNRNEAPDVARVIQVPGVPGVIQAPGVPGVIQAPGIPNVTPP